jgi:hypothetical protein
MPLQSFIVAEFTARGLVATTLSARDQRVEQRARLVHLSLPRLR